MTTVRLGVLVPHYTGQPGHPQDRPIGRAALRLAAAGIELVFGNQASDGALTGTRATAAGWCATRDSAVSACFDRFPCQGQPEAYTELRVGLGPVPVANPQAIVHLCRDKLRTQEVLQAAGVPMPEVCGEYCDFEAALRSWGVGFSKPRYGALGRGVTRVTPKDELKRRVPGVIEGELEPAILQRAVPPPPGLAGVSVRVLCQRLPDRTWMLNPAVARMSRTDPVVNAARGAVVQPLGDAFPQVVSAVAAVSLQVCQVLAQQPEPALLVELGVDVVLDSGLKPWVIEVNSRPRGRLEALAGSDPARFAGLHSDAVERPFRTLAAWYGS